MKRISVNIDEVDFFYADTNEERNRFAEIALKNRLYVPGWALFDNLQDIKRNYNDDEIIIAMYEGVIIGVHTLDWSIRGMWFTRPVFRKNGIGRKMTEIMSEHGHKDIKPSGIGRKDCIGFFYALGMSL